MKYQVELRSSHLILPPIIGNRLLNGYSSVYVAFKKDLNALLISPTTNSWFPKLHESLEFILKSKDLQGTKSIAIREILIDNDIDDRNKTLDCTLNVEKSFLKIDMTNFIEA